MKTIKYSNSIRVDRNHAYKPFGRVRELGEENGETSIEIERAINEYTFYFLYLSINNVVAKQHLTETEMIVLSAIMEKPLEFSLPVDSKDSKLSDIANELSTEEYPRTPNSIYQAAKRLRDKGYLIINEDSFIVPNMTLQALRRLIKGDLKEKGFATFDYVFKSVISAPQDRENL